MSMKSPLQRFPHLQVVMQHTIARNEIVVLIANASQDYATCRIFPLTRMASVPAITPGGTLNAPLNQQGLADLLRDRWTDRNSALQQYRELLPPTVPSGHAPWGSHLRHA